MQVLFVATVGGFVPQFEMNDVKILNELGCRIHYAANFDHNMYSYNEKIFDEYGINRHHVNLAKSPFRFIKNIRAYKEIKKIIEREKINIIHCHTPVGGLLARLAADQSSRKPKVIYTAHGFHFYKGAPLWNWCVYYPVEKFLARKTDVIITINEEDYCNAKKFTLRKNGRVYKIPGVGLNLNRFQSVIVKEDYIKNKNSASKEIKNNELQKNRNCEKNRFDIVTIGELNKNKNHQVVIRAIKQLNRDDIYYTIYGRGKNKEKLEVLIKSLDLEKYVQLKGYTLEPERVLEQADCFAFPSVREGLGMAALEALACKVPVISSDNRGTREYMKNGYNGVVCFSNNPNEYAKAIEDLAASEEKRVLMGENGKITAEKYGIKSTEDVMRLIYGTLISEM